MKLRKGDTVRVITGKDKGKEGVIEHVYPKNNTVLVTGVNTASRLEAQTKPLAVELLISAQLLKAAGYPPERFDLRQVDLRGVSDSLAALPVQQAAALPRILAAAR